MYYFLDLFFIFFHTAFTLFNLFGWIWKRTRKWNLATLLMTGFSWFILGIWYGFGYCPCTHWHWLVRLELGYTDMPNSYIKFLLDMLTGLDWNAVLVDWMTGVSFAVAFAASLYLNLFGGAKEGRTS